ncbi:hypothetical protein HUO13_01140 [Saccharopolyspora erythraea]|uniref:hypothetical protein n=1 Tax=Saccharopolyspora erythraea TaxID=1836 RepID=UPI001BA77F9B|nr:hypothetical protein [Saccharopolyspora erythraea]QUG99588.1 hypothetical protein HUO13_01140 [Saccharopolyspora erythraea]
MTSHTLNPASMRDALTALVDHIDGHRLPEPVTLSWSRTTGLQCQAHVTGALASLAAWADSLDQVGACLKQLNGGAVHLDVTGRLDGGIPVCLYTPYRAALTPRYRHLLEQGEPVEFTARQLHAAASHPRGRHLPSPIERPARFLLAETGRAYLAERQVPC